MGKKYIQSGYSSHNIGHISSRKYRSKFNKMPFDSTLMKMWDYIWYIRKELEIG